jgi:putative CocE/NonD family hydrolase
MRDRSLRLFAISLLVGLGVAASPAGAATHWTRYERPARYGVITQNDVPITMRDGIVLRGNVYRPNKPGRYPVIITQTPYNKTGPLASADTYLVTRGYVHVVVDVRGTGASQGSWDSFGPSEQKDGTEIVAWARHRSWSTGRIGLFGASYMAITQLVTAAQRPPGLKAIFPIVPSADSYRDITFSGGQINVSFIPLWLGLVTGGALVPPAYALDGNPADLVQGLTTLISHASGIGSFQANTVLNATAGGDIAYDGPFWKTRSPIELLDRINVPAFVVGGHHDLFQRGEPLVYERLRRHVNARLLMGPWTHLTGATGAGLPRDGVPSLDQIALRWFDRYLKGIDTHVASIPKVTQYTYGDEHYETQPDWPDPRLTPTRRYFRAGGNLSPSAPTGAEASDSFVQNPVSGVCTQSTSQWSAGATEAIPCTNDDRLNEPTGVTYTMAPMKRETLFSGPVMANVWTSTTARDAVLSVRVTDVAPDGSSKELTGGWLAASFRRLDRTRSRYVRGELIQPWHPFTRSSVEPVPAGQAMPLAVEVFPVHAELNVGHRLRVAVGPSDFPHAVPPAPQALGTLGGLVHILHDAAHPSYVTLPALGRCTRKRVGHRPHLHLGPCRALPVPRLLRG